MIDLIEQLGDSAAEFHSSVVLTYALDLELYDGLVRRVLNKAGVTNQVVFCDFRRYIEDIQIQRPRFLGRQYSVVPVHQSGAFHPKVYLLLGPKRGRMLVGSGNVTVGGLIRNAEVFGRFEYHTDQAAGPHPAFGEMVVYIRQLAERAPGIVARQLEHAIRSAGWLTKSPTSDGRSLLIGSPNRPRLFDQMLGLLPPGPQDDLLVCSSSFDRKLRGMSRLAGVVNTPPLCVVQADRAEVDGAEVKRLGPAVEWRTFVDPYPAEKRKRRDVFAHAKLFVFGHGDTETAMFGSCNASEPALMGPNSEVIVVLPTVAKGTTVERLGLKSSIETDARDSLVARTWPDSEEDELEPTGMVLLGVSGVESRFYVTLAGSDLPIGSHLVLAAGVGEEPVAIMPLQRQGGEIVTAIGSIDSVRVAWVVSSGQVPLSNAVVITWSDVAMSRRSGGLGKRVTEGIMAFHDGAVLGTVLFELLDSFRDFEVVRVGGVEPKTDANASTPELPSKARPAEFFYTDVRGPEETDRHWSGDRVDLDILASLIQPITGAPSGRNEQDEEDFDDSSLDEEAERRQIEAQKGRATGSERDGPSGNTTERLERARDRFARRLDRAAAAIERSLEFLDKLQTIPPQAVARQIWMTQIGAFMVGRTIRSKEGEEVEALAPLTFANYVIRVARALVGSRRGAFLDRLPPDFWATTDGDNLRRGLGFLRVCVVWSSAVLVDEFQSLDEDDEDLPESLACAVPELVAARFVAKVGALGISQDDADLARRFPGMSVVPQSRFESVKVWLEQLAGLVRSAEQGPIDAVEFSSFSAVPGQLVFNEKLGVTVLMDQGPGHFFLADLSRSGDVPAKYAAHVRPLLLDEVAPKIGCWYSSPGTSGRR